MLLQKLIDFQWTTQCYIPKTELFFLEEPGVHNPEEHNPNIHHCEIQSHDNEP
jgi:hypothetical protein